VKKTLAFVSLGVIAAILTHARAQTGAQRGEWKTYGGDLGHTKYSALDHFDGAGRPSAAQSRLACVIMCVTV
jgi:hypothetical protein